MLRGIYPIVFIPFNDTGNIHEADLRRIVQFELDGGVHGIGVNGFASEAYKMTDSERFRCAEIVADEVADRVPLIIGIAPGSTEAAIGQAADYAQFNPAALMSLPPNTMHWTSQDLVEHYVTLAQNSPVPIMIQQSPHIQAYSATGLPAESLAEIAQRAPNVHYFKIEGPASADRIAALKPLIDPDQVTLFGGGGGITLPTELKAGASGLIPGVGFNEFFVDIWAAWENNDLEQVNILLSTIQPLVDAISGHGHEFSLHARKYLMKRAGFIHNDYVRRPTVSLTSSDLAKLDKIADGLNIRISRRA